MSPMTSFPGAGCSPRISPDDSFRFLREARSFSAASAATGIEALVSPDAGGPRFPEMFSSVSSESVK